MKTWLRAAGVFLCLAWRLQGSPGGVEVRRASENLVEVQPGKVLTASFLVANHSGETEEMAEELILPPGWRKIAPNDLPFELPRDGPVVRIIAIVAPGDAAAQTYPLEYRVRSRGHPDLADRATLRARVLPTAKLSLALESCPEVVIGGEAYTAKLRVTNHGNRRLAVSTELKSSLNLPVQGCPSSLVLEPGGATELTLRIVTKPFRSRTRHVLTLRVIADDGVTSASQSMPVDVVAAVSGNADRYFRLPVALRTIVAQESGHSSVVQAELSGSGPVDESSKRRVDFLFRGPDAGGNSLLAERDEYRVSYLTSQWDLHLGDRNYSLSPLLERYGYGRGAGFDVRLGRWAAGAFYMKSRWRSPELTEVGAYASFAMSKMFVLRANFLRKESDATAWTAGFSQNLAGLQSRWTPGKFLDLEVEYGVSTDGRGLAQGRRVAGRGELGQASYAFERTSSETRFRGADSSADSTYASVHFPVFGKLRADFSLRDFTSYRDERLERSTVITHEKALRLDLRYPLGSRTELLLGFQDLQREDLLAPAAFNFHEQSVRLGVQQTIGKFHLRSSLDLGTIDDELRGTQNESFARYSVFASWRPTLRQDYSVYATYGPSAFTADRREQLSFGLSAGWRLQDNMTANVQYSRNTYDALGGGSQDTAQAQFSYTFANRNVLSLLGRWTKGSDAKRPDTAVIASFTVPFSMAVGRRKSPGEIRGRVLLEDRYSPRPLSRVIVLADDLTAVTDEGGEFVFPEVKPGRYSLRVDQASIGLERVATEAFPQTIEVKRGETRQLRIRVAAAGSVEVKMTLAGAAPGGFAGATVELTRGGESLVQQTDRNGGAIFQQLRPGRWRGRVRADSLPRFHDLENTEVEVEVSSGQAAAMRFSVVPRRRTIEFVDEGVVR
jgi:hypothetical protein